MKIGFLKESEDTRVSLTPEVVKKFKNSGHDLFLESGAGNLSNYSDSLYKDSVTICSQPDVIKNSEIIVSVNPIYLEKINPDFSGKIYVTNFNSVDTKKYVSILEKNKIQAFNLGVIPRTTIAQSMDILSSQANLSGYKAVIKAAELLPRMFPMIITAAGSVKPAKVVVLGAGVAGLQAIATAKRLGAIVEASDPRSAAREEVLSLGAKFIEVEGAVEDTSAGGYAVKQTKEFLEKQKEEVSKRLQLADVVVTTAQVLGGNSPILIPKSIVEKMKPGSVIIDLASASGGNCEMTEDDKIITFNKVKIVGNSSLSSDLSQDASNLFSNNVFNFLNYIINDNKIQFNSEDEIISQCNITKNLKFN